MGSPFRRRIWIQCGICARKKGVGRRLAFWLPLDMGDGNGQGTFIGRACDRQRKDKEDVSRAGEVRQESQRDDVISKVFQIDGPESDVEH